MEMPQPLLYTYVQHTHTHTHTHIIGLYRGVVEIGSKVVTSLAFTGPNCVVVGTSLGLEIVQLDGNGGWVKSTTVPHRYVQYKLANTNSCILTELV